MPLNSATDSLAGSTGAGSSGPARNAAAVTPSDSGSLAFTSRALFIGGAGTIAVDLAGTGTNVSFTVGAGQVLAIQASRVYATGTTATGIVALW